MTSVEIGLAMLAFMMVLLALRVHIGISMFLAGAVGYVWITGLNPLL
ncbi:MAG TPA: C4-dicarboxylate ABC transporter permease, partial [Pusillimonas sp.]|nr:C4-dicarboxylate ABC transporter permease [Pusillimonas sp.]